MFPFPKPNKATPNSDSNGHSEHSTKTIIQEFPPQPVSNQQQADLDSNKPQILEQDAEKLVKDEQQKVKHQKFPHRRLQGLSLKAKATAWAIALSTLPVIGIGATAYYFANQAVVKQIGQAQQGRAVALADQINRFMYDRYGDIQIMSSLQIFKNPKLRATTTLQEKQVALNRFLDAYLLYDSVAVFDLNGNLIAQSLGQPLSNHRNRDYFQQALKTGNPVISSPEISKSTGKLVIHLAAPIKDQVTGKTIAVVRARMPINRLEEVVKKFGNDQDEYILNDPSGKIFLASHKSDLGKNARKILSGLAQLEALNRPNTQIMRAHNSNGELLVSYSPVEKLPGMPELNWDAIVATDTAIAYAPQRQLLLTLILGTGLTALLVSAIATYLADRATRPILTAADTLEKLSQGELDTRVTVAGKDELATLGSNINLLAVQLQNREQALLESQEAQVEQARFFTNIGFLRVQGSQDLDSAFNKALKGARKILNVERMVVYRFNPDWSGYIAAESVDSGWATALAEKIEDPCIPQDLIKAYRKGRVVPTNNVFEAGFHSEHLKLMERLQIKANLVIPVLKDGELFCLLIAHHCSKPHAWQQDEINFLRQLGTQLGAILDRLTFLEQQKAAKEQLQKRALELLMEVDPVSKGDLTIRASVTADEIGTVADSYNATIRSLRKIVTQVQAAAQQMATTTSSSEGSVQELSAEALRQAEETTAALDRIQEMSNSIRAVATSAEQAEAAVQQATQTVEAGDVAMNRTVEGIMTIRDTVAETAQKVKNLGESSQKISKVVKLISSFADQTNLLALNAAIEAARAGEEGRGFAVVADEVQSLALQSAQATAEIESLVTDIQTETSELVTAMEAGTLQVAEGTRLVDETRQSLNRITTVSTQISGLVQTIASAASVQSQASQEVTQMMSDVAAIANQTSTEATQVSASFKGLLLVAEELRASAGQFKVM